MEKSEKIALQAILVAFFIFGIKLIAAIITGSIVKKDFASKGPAYVFSDSNVEVVLTEEEIPEAAIGKLGLSYGIE